MRMIDLELATTDLNKNLNLYYTTNNTFYPISEVIRTSDYFILNVTHSKSTVSLQDLLHASSSKYRQQKIFIQPLNKEKHLVLGYRIDHNRLILT